MLRIFGLLGLMGLASISWGQVSLSDCDFGLRVGQDWGTSSYGLLVEYQGDEGQTIHVSATSLGGLSKIYTAYLFDGDGELLDTEGLTYKYGGGPSVTFGGGTTYGVEGFAGLNYKNANVPFGLRLDWRPGVYLVGSDAVTEIAQFGLNVIAYIDEF